MKYRIAQMMQAEAGMYLVEGREASLVVMWALVESTNTHVVDPGTPKQKIMGLTVIDLRDDLESVIAERFDEEAPHYSSKVNSQSHTITR